MKHSRHLLMPEAPRAALIADGAKPSANPPRAQAMVQRPPATPAVTTEPTAYENRGRIRVRSLSFANMHEYGELFADLMRLRKHLFIDKRGWDLPNTNGYEFDQYDNPFSRWVVLHRYGEILAGVRLTPTTAKCGVYSYMIRDAQRGLLDNIPTDLLICTAPVDPNVWEASRIFITDQVSGRERLAVQALLFQAMTSTVQKEGGRFIMGIVPYLWSRWGRRIGTEGRPFGPKRLIAGELCQVALMKTQPLRLEHALPN